MKLLIVMVRHPFPPRYGGSIVAINSMERLSKRHKIHFLCFDHKDAALLPAGIVETAEIIPKNRLFIIHEYLRYLSMRLRGPSTADHLAVFRGLRRRVSELMETENFDAILMFEFDAVQYCNPKYHSKLIVNIEDPYSIKRERMKALSVFSIWQRLVMSVDSVIARYYERTVLPLLGKVLLLSQSDANDMSKQLGCKNIGCVAYGVNETKPDCVELDKRSTGMIVFSGNMFHPPNVDGILFFINNVFKLVLQGFAGAKLWIVGSDPDPRIYIAARPFGDRIVITGRVDDVSEYIKKAMVSICPVRLKIGVQTKILESLVLGTPVVTTSAGNSGVGGIDGNDLLIEDEPILFAQRVVSLLQAIDWMKFSENGKKMVQAQFSWDKSVYELEQHIMSIKYNN